MRITENECVDCGLPCQGIDCPYYRVTRFYCDECKCEETLYDYDGEELCSECLLKKFNVIEGSDH